MEDSHCIRVDALQSACSRCSRAGCQAYEPTRRKSLPRSPFCRCKRPDRFRLSSACFREIVTGVFQYRFGQFCTMLRDKISLDFSIILLEHVYAATCFDRKVIFIESLSRTRLIIKMALKFGRDNNRSLDILHGEIQRMRVSPLITFGYQTFSGLRAIARFCVPCRAHHAF